MRIEEVEDYLVGLLSASLTDVEVAPMPEKESDFQRTFITVRITVGYSGSDGGAEKSTSEVMQELKSDFSVLIEGRKLRGDGGIYDILRKTKSILLGASFENFKYLRFKKEDRLEKVDDIIRFVQVFSGDSFWVTDADELGGVAINQISFNKI
jgi:hypothetical protein